MSSGLLARAGGYLLALAVLLLVCRLKRLPLRETLGLYLPKTRDALLYSFLFACLAAGSEWLGSTLGLPAVTRWQPVSLGTTAIRLLAMVILAPVTEELVFRGLLYTKIEETRLRAAGAIVLPALLFAAAHYDKQLGAVTGVALLLILVDGLYLGLVRCRTNSTPLTIALHAAANGFAAFQRMP